MEVVNLKWNADIQGLHDECLANFEDTLEQDVYSHYGKDTYRVITPFGEKGIYECLDKHADTLSDLLGVKIGHSYVVQEPNSYYMHHCDPVATAFFSHSIHDKLNLIKYFVPTDRVTTPEQDAAFFRDLCSYVYEAAEDRSDMFIGIKDRLAELKSEYQLNNDIDLSDDDIDYWRSISPRCSINVQLNEGHSPVNYIVDGVETDYTYDIGLLNVDALHGVYNSNNRRLIARFVIYDKTFTEVDNFLSLRKYQIH